MTTDRKFTPGDMVRRTDGEPGYFMVTGYSRSGMVEARQDGGRQATVSRPESGWELVTTIDQEPLMDRMDRRKRAMEALEREIRNVERFAITPEVLGVEVDDA